MNQPSVQTLSQTILRVRKLAQSRLARFSQLDPVDCTESYLFNKDHFCGIRFSLGFFKAEWRLNQTQIQFIRNGNQIGVVDIDPSDARRAA